MTKNTYYITVILFFLSVFIVNAQSFSEKNILNQSSKIDSVCQKWNTNNTPGLSIAISKKNTKLYSKSYGMANLNKSSKITSKTTFNIASLTKQFVAYSILLLEQEGKLSLNENIRKYLPGLKYSKIKVRHLLHHTSGIPEHWGIWSLSSFTGDNIEDIYNIHKQQTQTKFTAGDKYEYCNANYILLSLIIKRVSKQSLVEYMKEHLFEKLGMQNTYFLTDLSKNDSNQAENYQFDGQNYIATPQVVSDIVGDGGLFSSVEDLQIWNEVFYNNSSLSKKRKEIGVLNSGESNFYGAGLQKFVKENILSYEHGGGAQGASCYFAQFPEHKISITILANTDEINAMAIFEEIRTLVFQSNSNGLIDSLKTNNTVDWNKLDSISIKSYEGKYYGFSNETATSFDISISNNDTLIGNSFGRPSRKYVQSNTNEFSATNLHDLKLKVQSDFISIHFQRFNLGSFKKINDTIKIELSKVIGDYSSTNINNGVWNISNEENEITVITPRSKSFKLISLGNNLFHIKEMNILLLFLESKHGVSLKLIHQGVGELTLQKV